jgi:hypothetical protein
MLTKDFDAAFDADAPAEFTLCGQTFHATGHVPYTQWRTLIKRETRPDVPTEDEVRYLFTDLLDPADIDRFVDVLSSPNGNSPNQAQMMAVYGWLLEVASGKARENAETSSAG